MSCMIDLWWERRDPLLRVWDRESGSLLLEMRGPLVRELIEEGEFNATDLEEFQHALVHR